MCHLNPERRDREAQQPTAIVFIVAAFYVHMIVVAVAVVVIVIIHIIVLFVDSSSHVVSFVVCAEIWVCAYSVWRAVQAGSSALCGTSRASVIDAFCRRLELQFCTERPILSTVLPPVGDTHVGWVYGPSVAVQQMQHGLWDALAEILHTHGWTSPRSPGPGAGRIARAERERPTADDERHSYKLHVVFPCRLRREPTTVLLL